ncbi:MAG: SUMF1/EgtB/PvdO family nonheme iron enzyme [Pseudomonadota bacterium]
MTSQKRIFLGHASEDKPQVRELYHQLKAKGLEPWLDAVDLMPGQLWRVEIPKAIKSAAVFLACLSKTSVAKRSYVQREFRHALSVFAELPPGSIYLIPVRLDDCEVPDLQMPELALKLADVQWVDLFEDDGFDRLVASIERALGRASSEVVVKKGPSSTVPLSTHSVEPLSASKASSSSHARNPAIIAEWIGAVAIICAGLLSSPRVAEMFAPGNQPLVPSTGTPQEPAASGHEVSIVKSMDSRQPFEPFRDCDQDTCPQMVMLPAGSFMMGSPSDEEGRSSDEGPQHMVTISQPFAMGKNEVTFEQYDRFAEATGRDSADDNGWSRGRHPVINVSWDDARAFCYWLGNGYRLPTEAEWEYAARADRTTPFSFGETIMPDQVNYDGNYPYGSSPKGPFRGRTIKVGSLSANAWGLHEMHGNVREWTSDWYGDYETVAQTDPKGLATGEFRVVRGGSWLNYARYVRSAHRGRGAPDDRNRDLGFRCAKGLKS